MALMNTMQYPAFFDAVPHLRLRDPLAEFLGAIEDGVVEYTYVDAVKLAGHSCPTVASAYWDDSPGPERAVWRRSS